MTVYYKVVRNILSQEECDQCADRMNDNKKESFQDTQCPKSLSFYGFNKDFVERMKQHAEEIFGQELFYAFDYCRIYPKDEVLKRHLDRTSCQYSVTVNLRNSDSPWVFFFEHPETGERDSVTMLPGDSVFYMGCLVPHWREENPSEEVHQMFFHFTDEKLHNSIDAIEPEKNTAEQKRNNLKSLFGKKK